MRRYEHIVTKRCLLRQPACKKIRANYHTIMEARNDASGLRTGPAPCSRLQEMAYPAKSNSGTMTSACSVPPASAPLHHPSPLTASVRVYDFHSLVTGAAICVPTASPACAESLQPQLDGQVIRPLPEPPDISQRRTPASLGGGVVRVVQ